MRYNLKQERKMKYPSLLVFIFIMAFVFVHGQNSSSQQHKNKSSQQESLPGNEIHDRLYYMFLESESVKVPESAVIFLQSIEEPAETASKMMAARLRILKVIYNTKISAADKSFLCQHMSEANQALIWPIEPLLKEYLLQN